MQDFLLTNVQYLGQNSELLVQNGKIAQLSLASKIDASKTISKIDGKGQILFPSLIDCHVHLREPGYEWKEDITSGLNAALHGGFGAVMCMANTKPVNDHAAITIQMLKKAELSPVKLYPIAAATIALKGLEMAPLHELKEAGCVAVSNDGAPVADTEMFRRIMEYASDLNMIVIDHCEDPYLAKNTHMNEGKLSAKLGIKASADIAESIQAARDIMLAEYLDIPVHIAHVSAKSTVDIIAYAKARGVKVSAETCPHYLLLDENAIDNYNTLAKVNPPLRTQKDVAALRAGIKDGTIDMLVTDHAPHAIYEKDVTLDQAPNGISGLDTALTLSYELVRQGVITEQDLIRLWLEAPSKIFNLPANLFRIGDSADFSLFDPDLEWLVNAQTMYSKSANTPFINHKLQGKVSAHYIGGVARI